MDINDDCSKPMQMYGTCADHQALLQRVSLKLEYPFELQLKSPVATILLRKSGHALVCICPACLTVDEGEVCTV